MRGVGGVELKEAAGNGVDERGFGRDGGEGRWLGVGGEGGGGLRRVMAVELSMGPWVKL